MNTYYTKGQIKVALNFDENKILLKKGKRKALFSYQQKSLWIQK